MKVFKHEKIAELVGREYSAATLETYVTSFKHTYLFLQWKYKIDDMNIEN